MSSNGRTLGCQSGYTGSSPVIRSNDRVAQLDGAPRYEREGWGFESLRDHHFSTASQSARQMPAKHQMRGSTPRPWSTHSQRRKVHERSGVGGWARPSFAVLHFGGEVAMARHHVCTVALAGSNPVASTISQPVAQLDSASPSEGEGQWFESTRVDHRSRLGARPWFPRDVPAVFAGHWGRHTLPSR